MVRALNLRTWKMGGLTLPGAINSTVAIVTLVLRWSKFIVILGNLYTLVTEYSVLYAHAPKYKDPI